LRASLDLGVFEKEIKEAVMSSVFSIRLVISSSGMGSGISKVYTGSSRIVGTSLKELVVITALLAILSIFCLFEDGNKSKSRKILSEINASPDSKNQVILEISRWK
jgi:hypothetical protein